MKRMQVWLDDFTIQLLAIASADCGYSKSSVVRECILIAAREAADRLKAEDAEEVVKQTAKRAAKTEEKKP